MSLTKYMSALIVIFLTFGMLGAYAANKKTASSKGHGFMVPPPPPVIPVGGQFVYMPGLPPSSMSESELKSRFKELNDEVAKAQKELDDTKNRTEEKRQRGDLFVNLYKEGVISRRELETAQAESDSALQQVNASSQKLKEIQTELNQVQSALQKREKSRQPKKNKLDKKKNM